jgi:Flp pilus assembly protein TadB
MHKKNFLFVVLILVGVLLVTAGALLKDEAVKEWSGVLIGVGAGLTGMSLANLVTAWVEARNPAYSRQVAIEQKDERNQLINNAAKAKAFQAFTPVMGMLMLVFVLIKVELLPLLLLVGAYILVYIFYFVSLNKYLKEM